MLDIKFIRENVEKVKEAVKNKKVELDVEHLLEVDQKRIKLAQEMEELNSLKNDINDLIAKAADDAERKEIIAKGAEIKEKLGKVEPEYKKVLEEYKALLNKIPNIYSGDTPVGKDEEENVVIRKKGEPTTFDFTPKEHWQLGEELGVIDIERAAKVSGSRFNYLKGELAMLEFALVQYCFSILADETILKEIALQAGLKVSTKPFVPVVPPVLIKPESMERMARLEPREERYHIPSDNLFLVGSAEHTLGSMYLDETLAEKDLPLRYIGFSTAFRREAGSYGKDMKGILRVHQFDKLEMESFSTADQSLDEQNFIVAIQEYLIGSLGLPYQVVQICTGDMGGPDFRQIDIETWMPGQNKYRETNTSDNMTDYQSRRMNTRVKRESGQTELVHTNDATAFAIGRTIIAIMENYQQADGSIVIPEVLKRFMPVPVDVIRKK